MENVKRQPPHPIYLIDASIYIFRSYFALPPNWESKDGYSTEAVYGYTRFLIEFISKVSRKAENGGKPLVASAFDESLGSCFRNEIYPDYKCSRALPDEELAFQLQACRDVTEILGISCFSSERYEADDLIGSLAQALRCSTSYSQEPYSPKHPMCIVTRDKDLAQLLVHADDCLWDYADDQLLFSEDVEKKFGVPPKKIADYLALVGDSSDDIPGVPGIGAKTAAAILKDFDHVEDMLDNTERLSELTVRGAKSLPNKIIEHGEQVVMAKALSSIFCEAPLEVGYLDSYEHKYKPFSGCEDISLSQPCWECFAEFCEDMGLGPRLLSYAEQQLKECE